MAPRIELPYLSSLAVVRQTCLFVLALIGASIAFDSHAQGANVDLSQPADTVSETRDDQRQESVGVVRVYFAFAAQALEPTSRSVLRRLAEEAIAAPETTVVISAHTDNRGWALGNLELSRIRARSVASALMENGVDVTRMRAFAHGESQPIAPNSTVQGRRLNRRVEVSLKP